MKIVSVSLLLATVALGGCVQSGPSAPAGAPTLSMVETPLSAAELRKEEMLRDLATCESGGHGQSHHPIYRLPRPFLGPLPVMTRTGVHIVPGNGRDPRTGEGTRCLC